MYCSNCGKPLPDNSTFCAFCGEKQGIPLHTETPSVPSGGFVQRADMQSCAQSQSKSTRRVAIWLLAIVGTVILLALLAPQIVRLFGNGTRGTPNITADQIQQDLVENDVYIVTGWWEDAYHLYFAEFEFERIDITNTRSQETVIYLDVHVTGETEYGARIDDPFIVTYKKFKEGWAFAAISYEGHV